MNEVGLLAIGCLIGALVVACIVYAVLIWKYHQLEKKYRRDDE